MKAMKIFALIAGEDSTSRFSWIDMFPRRKMSGLVTTGSPITEVPDYVWARRYDKPKYPARRISHPDAESALQAAKKACHSSPGRWYGRASTNSNAPEFLVHEGIKVVERHVVGH